MPLMDIATGRVIEEVRLRPTIWDATDPYYKNKQARQHAWLEVFHALVPDFDNLPSGQQADVDKAIQQRWKTARDAYMRTKAVIKSGALVKKYFYYDHCSFLEKNEAGWCDPKQSADESNLIKRRKVHNIVQVQTPSLTSAPDSPVASPSSNDTDLMTATTSNIMIKQEPYNVEENLAEENYHDQLHTELDIKADSLPENPLEDSNIRTTTKKLPKSLNFKMYEMLKETTRQLNNDNMSFFMSMLPIVNQFSDRQKLLFRSEVIKVAMEISSTQKSD